VQEELKISTFFQETNPNQQKILAEHFHLKYYKNILYVSGIGMATTLLGIYKFKRNLTNSNFFFGICTIEPL
jgi:hypothetical protein